MKEVEIREDKWTEGQYQVWICIDQPVVIYCGTLSQCLIIAKAFVEVGFYPKGMK